MTKIGVKSNNDNKNISNYVPRVNDNNIIGVLSKI